MTSSSGPIAIPQAPSAAAPSTSPIQSPRSLRSVSSTNSLPPEIASNTLSLLAQFHNDRSKQEAKLAQLEARAKAEERARQKAANAAAAAAAEAEAEDDDDDDDAAVAAEAEAWADIERLARIDAGIEQPPPSVDVGAVDEHGTTHTSAPAPSDHISVDEWRQVMKEDYQQSQFWYSSPFAYKLARNIHAHLEKKTTPPKVAFLCSPTAYVAFQHLYCGRAAPDAAHHTYTPGENLFMLEIDPRFRIAAGAGYVRYDFNTPTKGLGSLAGDIDMVVIDPPFLNERTTDGIAETVHHLLCADASGSILLITGDSILGYAKKRYPLPGQPDLIRSDLDIDHEGGRLSNEFSAYVTEDMGREFGEIP